MWNRQDKLKTYFHLLNKNKIIIILVILVRPKIPLDSRHKEITALAGDQYKVEIPFEASPLPTVAITRDDQSGQAVPIGDRQKVEVS